MKKWYRYLLYTLIAAALVLSVWTGWQRHRLEAGNRTVSLVVDYDQVLALADWENISPRELLTQLVNGPGITGLLFKEQTLVDSVIKDVWLRTGEELLTNPVFAGSWGEIKPEYTYLLTRSEQEYQRLVLNLKVKLSGVESFVEPAAGVYLVGVPLPAGMVKQIGLGFPAKGLQLAADMRLQILPQIRTWAADEPEDITRVFSQLTPYRQRMGAVLFNDGVLPPFRDRLAAEIEQLEVPLAAIEMFPQGGLPQLAQMLDKRLVRLHAISSGEMAKYTPARAVDRFVLAATDRNNRILFARFFMDLNRPGLLQYNAAYLDQLVGNLEQAGFDVGRAETLPPFPPSRTLLFFIGLGAIAGAVLLLNLVGYPKLGGAAGVLLLLLWAGMLATGFGGFASLARKLFALGAAVVFPSLSVIYFVSNERRSLGRAAAALVGTAALSLVGAVLMVGLLADKSFMLNLDQFIGVKAAFIGPPALVFLAFAFLKHPREEWVPRVRRLLRQDITVKYAVAAAVLGLVGIVYIMRSGNETALVSSFELELRRWLNDIMIRPRTKEFLIGHPLLMLIYYKGYREYLLPVLTLAVIGQVSLVNTFAHTWTPLAISVTRTLNGLWLGLLAGAALILLVKIWHWLEAKYLGD